MRLEELFSKLTGARKTPEAKPMTPTTAPSLVKPAAPLPVAAAAPDLNITPQQKIADVKPAEFFNKGNPYNDLSKEAEFRQQYGGDMSERQYSDPYTQEKYNRLYEGQDLQKIQHPGAGGRFKLALKGALLGAANNPTGDMGGLIGGAIGGAAGGALSPTRAREWQYDMGEGRQVAEQIGRQREEVNQQGRLAQILSQVGFNTARTRAANEDVRIKGEKLKLDQQSTAAEQAIKQAQEQRNQDLHPGAMENQQATILNQILNAASKRQELPLAKRKAEADLQLNALRQQQIQLENQFRQETDPIKKRNLALEGQRISANIARLNEQTTGQQWERTGYSEDEVRKIAEEKGVSPEEARRILIQMGVGVQPTPKKRPSIFDDEE